MSRVFFGTRLPSLTDCWLTLFFFCVLQLPRSNKTCPSCKHEEAVFFQSQQRSAETGMVSYTSTTTRNMRWLTLVEIVLRLLRVRSHLHMSMTCMNTPRRARSHHRLKDLEEGFSELFPLAYGVHGRVWQRDATGAGWLLEEMNLYPINI